MLSRNGYRKYVLDKCIREFFNHKFTTKSLLLKKKDSTPEKSFIRLLFLVFIRANSQRTEVFPPQTH